MAYNDGGDDELISNQIIDMRAFKHKNNVAFGFVAPEASKRAFDLIDGLDLDQKTATETTEVKFRTEKSKTYKSILLLKDQFENMNVRAPQMKDQRNLCKVNHRVFVPETKRLQVKDLMIDIREMAEAMAKPADAVEDGRGKENLSNNQPKAIGIGHNAVQNMKEFAKYREKQQIDSDDDLLNNLDSQILLSQDKSQSRIKSQLTEDKLCFEYSEDDETIQNADNLVNELTPNEELRQHLSANLKNNIPSKPLLEDRELSNLITYLDNNNSMTHTGFVDFLSFCTEHEIKRVDQVEQPTERYTKKPDNNLSARLQALGELRQQKQPQKSEPILDTKPAAEEATAQPATNLKKRTFEDIRTMDPQKEDQLIGPDPEGAKAKKKRKLNKNIEFL